MTKNLTALHLVKHPEPRASTACEYLFRIEQVPAVQAPDELVPYPFGLEDAAATRIVRNGTLPAAKIGRRLYAKRSDVLALVSKLAFVVKPDPTGDAEADYAALVGRTGGGR